MVNINSKKQEKQKKEETGFYLVLPKIAEIARKKDANLSQVIDAVRAAWIKSLPSKLNLSKKEQSEIVSREELIAKCKSMGVELPKPNSKLLHLVMKYGMDSHSWQYDTNFVFKYRLHLPIRGIYNPQLEPTYDLFFRLFRKFYKGKVKGIKNVLENFDLSIRPLNLCSSIMFSEAVRNFLPEIEQKFIKDPFGVQRREHLVLDEKNGKLVYLATRKIEHGTYLAILQTVAYCTAGCARCYRGEQTRELKQFKAINPDGSESAIYFLPPSEQVKLLVRRWNKEKNPPEDILFSGGEPMDIDLDEWLKIIEGLKKAKFLKFFRICTGDLFLGESFRLIQLEFLEALKQFYKETGKAIKFVCNLPHPAFITPEAVYTIMTLHEAGFGIEIQSQTPLEEGVLCFQGDMQKKLKEYDGVNNISDTQILEAWAPSLARSFKLLRELGVKISMVADRPYKFIHDMQQSVSLIYTTVLFSLLSEPHIGTTDAAVRPTSFAAFMPKLPNLNLGFHSLEYLANVDGAHKTTPNGILIRLPHAFGEIAEYEEPLWIGINDIDTLKRITDINFWKKLRYKVKELVDKNVKYEKNKNTKIKSYCH
ncbi:hypothetical protein COV56_02975 [Candidatus Kuenenbacteria bacterium CG11_big_fil_rev_8_21_14_0_20_37_9]|uniref:Uncharacterized protein n=1 Tax=Candidatus Kuenenbacteria bacterium CG08_land_8_20_14_0_20_37_23 TaxID=1974617 RepID=A0A2M6XSG3_9BACT|nr:MAG: hypothetical protein COV56_02975 [Candidatus Kuenenbacteria bacterium CG11_big_fil_rev_8_21_14_0_20_37_9]PIU10541.1 MAG: hypothetical protein COT27_02555 [Candidatus Kuenenbacteria bacterium CG08_land_8_20_14_0_20_37_23]